MQKEEKKAAQKRAHIACHREAGVHLEYGDFSVLWKEYVREESRKEIKSSGYAVKGGDGKDRGWTV